MLHENLFYKLLGIIPFGIILSGLYICNMKKEVQLPFQYGNTVSVGSFTNREKDVKKLKNNLLNGINTIIISPRRWGKSSLVEKTLLGIKSSRKKVAIVQMDLFSVSTVEEFLELFAREVIKASTPKWEEWLTIGKQFFKQLIPKFSIQADPLTDFSMSFEWSELRKHADEILALPEKIAAKKKMKFIVCLDEFQHLAELKGYKKLDKKMRAVWQRQKNVTYCLYGSKRHMMDDIFNKSSNPFYRFGDIVFLQKIKQEKWTSFITKSFTDTKKQITPEASIAIPRLMKNHSWYVQQLSHYVWESCGKKATIKDVEKALKRLVETNSPLYIMQVESLSKTQLNLLKAISNGEEQLTSGKVMARYEIGTPQNVIKNRKILARKDIILGMGKAYEMADPAFDLWFQKVYFRRAFDKLV